MTYWLKGFLFAALLGFTQAHHFIRLVILAALGLAGLWMVHTLAQDFNTIQISNNSERDLFKRSIPNHKQPQINWEAVLTRDPASCARSFLCQLAATEENTLSKEERLILGLVRHSAENKSWAGKQLLEALRDGERVKKPNHCMKIYKYCPYTSQMMMTILRMFGH